MGTSMLHAPHHVTSSFGEPLRVAKVIEGTHREQAPWYTESQSDPVRMGESTKK